MASLSPAIRQTFFFEGVPIANGFVYTYAAGTTTPLATYTDADGTYPNTNPIELDAYGVADVWLGSSAYKFVVQDATYAECYTVDNVSSSQLSYPIVNDNATNTTQYVVMTRQTSGTMQDPYISTPGLYFNPRTGVFSIGGVDITPAGPQNLYNIGLGKYALASNSSGTYNVVAGFGAAYNNTIGSFNIALGADAAYSNSTGTYNIAIGTEALKTNLSASYNIAIGSSALYNCTGSYNTAVGSSSMQTSSSGVENTALGYRSLYGNTIGFYNVALGVKALELNSSGYGNTSVGYTALQANTSGSGNNAIGYKALQKNTTGTNNIALGVNALQGNTSGNSNVALGYQSLLAHTTGENNVALGANALLAITSGNYNVAVGPLALSSATTCSLNTAVGYAALVQLSTGIQNAAFGNGAMSDSVVTGNYNTAVGPGALKFISSGNYNTGIGDNGGGNITTGSGNVVLGTIGSSGSGLACFNVTTENDRFVAGADSVTNAYVKVAWTVTSDARDKTDIIPATYGLEFVMGLKPVEYLWDERSKYENKAPDGSKKGEKRQLGFLAQDIIELEKKFGRKARGLLIADDEQEDHLRMVETKIIPALVNALQELKQDFDAYKQAHP